MLTHPRPHLTTSACLCQQHRVHFSSIPWASFYLCSLSRSSWSSSRKVKINKWVGVINFNMYYVSRLKDNNNKDDNNKLAMIHPQRTWGVWQNDDDDDKKVVVVVVYIIVIECPIGEGEGGNGGRGIFKRSRRKKWLLHSHMCRSRICGLSSYSLRAGT